MSWPSLTISRAKIFARNIINSTREKNNAFPYHTKFCCFSNIQRFINVPKCYTKIVHYMRVYMWVCSLCRGRRFLIWWCCVDVVTMMVCGGASCFKFLVQKVDFLFQWYHINAPDLWFLSEFVHFQPNGVLFFYWQFYILILLWW